MDSDEQKGYLASVFWISVYSYLASGLLARMVEYSWYSVMMRVFNIPHHYKLIYIEHGTRSLSYWNDLNILFIYGVGGVIMVAVGTLLFHELKKKRKSDWVVTIFITWLTLHFINAFLGGLIAGNFVYDRIGFAIRWMFPALPYRLAISLLPFVIWVFSAGFFSVKFLSTCLDKKILSNTPGRRRYLRYVMLFPWMAATVVLSIADMFIGDRYNIVLNFAMLIPVTYAMFRYPLYFYIARCCTETVFNTEKVVRSRSRLVGFIVIVFGIFALLKFA